MPERAMGCRLVARTSAGSWSCHGSLLFGGHLRGVIIQCMDVRALIEALIDIVHSVPETRLDRGAGRYVQHVEFDVATTHLFAF